MPKSVKKVAEAYNKKAGHYNKVVDKACVVKQKWAELQEALRNRPTGDARKDAVRALRLAKMGTQYLPVSDAEKQAIQGTLSAGGSIYGTGMAARRAEMENASGLKLQSYVP